MILIIIINNVTNMNVGLSEPDFCRYIYVNCNESPSHGL